MRLAPLTAAFVLVASLCATPALAAQATDTSSPTETTAGLETCVEMEYMVHETINTDRFGTVSVPVYRTHTLCVDRNPTLGPTY